MNHCVGSDRHETRKILEFLEPFEAGDRQNISQFLNDIFPYKPNLQHGEQIKENGMISHFLDEINKYANFDNRYSSNGVHGFSPIMAFITPDGRKVLMDEKERELNEKAQKSAIDANRSAINVNDSIIATNNAIQQTNTLMLGHATTQDGLIDRQLKLVSRQNRLYIYTLVLAAINVGLGIAIYSATVSSNADKQSISTLQSQLVTKDKEIKSLRLLKSDTVRYVLHYPKQKSKGR